MKIGNLEVYGVIYKITNKINNKVYIGQTVLGFKKRYDNTNWWEKTHNEHLKSSVLKYGTENFDVSEIYDIAFSKAELDVKEVLYIKLYKSNNRKFGYNKKDGGANGLHSIESRIKMSKTHKGVKLSEETRRKMSEVRKGKNKGKFNPMYGRNPYDNLSDEDYQKLIKIKRENMKGEKNPMYGAYGEKNPFYGKQHSDKTKMILSEKTKQRLAKNNPLKGRKIPKNEYGNNPKSANNIKMTILKTGEVLLFDSVKRCAEWLIDNEIVKTYSTGKWAINESIKNKKEYKGYYFEKIKK